MKHVLENILLYLLKALNLFRSRKGVALLSSSIPESNLGDQALLVGAIVGIQNLTNQPLLVLKHGSLESPRVALENYPQLENIIIDEKNFLAFVTPRAFKERMNLMFTLASYHSFFIIGADIIDGIYGGQGSDIRKDIISKLDFLGVKCTMLGSSLSDKVTDEAKSSLTTIDSRCNLFARDKYSLERMHQHNIKAELSADVAFLMSPKDTTIESFFGKKITTERVIGLCLKDTDLGEDIQVHNQYLELLTKLLFKPEVSLVILPHHPNDFLTMKSLVSKLPTKFSSKVFISDKFPSAAEIKGLAKHCDLVITGRMHVAIASLGANTSVLCIPYANKFEGLLNHFQLDENMYILKDKSLTDLDSACLQVETILEHINDSQQQISKMLPAVKELSIKNFFVL
jgi:polysaccharide pyruvyl transferase WcaK-like protein